MNLLKTPITGELDFVHLFLLIGAIIISIALWAILMSYITRGVAAAASAV